MRGLAASAFVLITIVAAAVLSGQAVAQASEVIYRDSVTGLSFRAPAGLAVTPARPGVGGRTTQAIYSTYRGADDPKVSVDLREHLVITAYVASRLPNEDLRMFAARNAGPAQYTTAALARFNGIVITGSFQTGPRTYALIPRSPDQVLVIDAFPTFSNRIGLFSGVLASLEVK